MKCSQCKRYLLTKDKLCWKCKGDPAKLECKCEPLDLEGGHGSAMKKKGPKKSTK